MPASAPYTTLTAYSAHQADVFSFTGNQAALANINSLTGGVYGERRFLLQELSLYHLAFAMPTSTGNFGLKAGYFGGSDYNESQLGLAYGRRLGSKIDIGVQFNYYNFRISGYGNTSSINFEAGTIIHLTEQLHAGIHTYNPTGSKLGKNDEEQLPSVHTAGIGYEPSESFLVSVEVQKTENENIAINAGVQYILQEKLLARGGFTSGNSSYYLGFGVFLKEFRLDATVSIHPQLGLTPGLMLIFKNNSIKQ
ncbi:MAG: hypothetical protein ABR502_11320 [Chitinophagaceae bacterium]